MYVPTPNRQDDAGEIYALIDAVRLGTFVTVFGPGGPSSDGGPSPGPAEPLVSHVPMLLDRSRGEFGTLRFHLARANPQARALAGAASGLAIFLGPSAYVSPSWYASKGEHGKVVPTWNYLAVHAHGPVRLLEEPHDLLAVVDALTRRHEGARPQPWDVADAPAPYVETLLRAIVGVEIEIARLDGKWKLGQGESAADTDGVAAGLESGGDAEDLAVAAAMRRANG